MSRVVGVGPSLVDVGAKLPDSQYLECCDILGASPGEWRRIEDAERVEKLLRTLTNTAFKNISLVDSLNRQPNRSVVAGSSVLGMLGAMPPAVRSQSAYVSTYAMQEKAPDPLSVFFSESVKAAGITHSYQRIQGRNPVGFVLSGSDNPEKTLGMYPGVANELEDYDMEKLRPELIILDTYELLEGEMARYLDATISSGEHRIALSLGNHTILEGRVRDKLRGYITKGRIDVLCGNTAEYQKLYPELDPVMATKDGFRSHPVRENIPYVLMTHGEDGVIASWNGTVVDTPAPDLDRSSIVNTSGAGDVTAGIFCVGILEKDACEETLLKAAHYASQVLQIQGSMILADS
jgi:sugar/nucleoside kinase (ribokinase family)